jgi:D-alanine-D-alanine ligase
MKEKGKRKKHALSKVEGEKGKIRVAVLLGGSSSERAISFASGKMVMKHLPVDRYKTIAYDPGKPKDLIRLIRDAKARKIDVFFNALHGTHGEDGHIQGLLEILGLPYTGSGVLASAQAMDKSRTKDLYASVRIPSPKGITVAMREFKKNQDAVIRTIAKKLGRSIVVKPNASGSSVGLSVRPPRKDWKRAIAKALKEDKVSCLVESLIEGRELTVPVLENKGVPHAMPVIEIRTASGLFDYKAKYHDKRTQEICPAPISRHATRLAKQLAMKAHAVLGCRGYSRTDMILDERGRLWVLETNTLPGLTAASLLPKAAKEEGMELSELLERILGHTATDGK